MPHRALETSWLALGGIQAVVQVPGVHPLSCVTPWAYMSSSVKWEPTGCQGGCEAGRMGGDSSLGRVSTEVMPAHCVPSAG